MAPGIFNFPNKQLGLFPAFSQAVTGVEAVSCERFWRFRFCDVLVWLRGTVFTRLTAGFMFENITSHNTMSTQPENPYATPVSNPIPDISPTLEAPLASRGSRFVGAFVDGLVIAAIVFPLSFLLTYFGIVSQNSTGGSFVLTLLITLIGFAAFIGINWKFLSASGQTIGKKVAKTRIVGLGGEKAPMNDLLKRYAFSNLIGIIPVAGTIISIINVLFIFKSDHRCIHDLIGKTKVVQATI